MSAEKIESGDIVQVIPDGHSKFSYCLFVVDEVRSWGIVCYMDSWVDGERGLIWLRLETDKFAYVGRTEYRVKPINA